VVLSDRTIRRLIAEGRIAIDPYDESLLQPSSVDVRVDRYFRVFHNSRYGFIDVKEPQDDLTELVEMTDETPFILHPGEFVLGSTLERLRLPDDLVARLEGKSSLGRLGLLIHSTAGFIDPGWDGHVTLELSNVANLPITIYHGMKIGQLSFVRLTEPAEAPYGTGGLGSKYQGQKGPTPSRYWQNFRAERESDEGRSRGGPRQLPGRRGVVTVLVTGGTGFVGTGIVHALRAEDRAVRCLVRDPRKGSTLASWGCELVEGDMTDAASLRRAVDGCDRVIHLVAIRSGRRSEFERLMEQGTRDLVAAAREAGVGRFVLMSALGVSEETKDLVPYYHAKWDMEQTIEASGLEHVIFRPSFIFAEEGGALGEFKRVVKLSPVTPVVGSGEQRLQPIWRDDVAAYFAKGLDLPEAANRTFELGGPDVVTWEEFWRRLRRALRVRRPLVHVPVPLLRVQATLLEALPNPPLTRDLLKMLLAGDNVVSDTAAVETFRLPLVPLDEQLRRAT
jgi:dCTP deaminase